MISRPSISKPPSAAAAVTSSTLPMSTGVMIPSFFSRAAASRMRASVPSVYMSLRGLSLRRVTRESSTSEIASSTAEFCALTPASASVSSTAAASVSFPAAESSARAVKARLRISASVRLRLIYFFNLFIIILLLVVLCNH